MGNQCPPTSSPGGLRGSRLPPFISPLFTIPPLQIPADFLNHLMAVVGRDIIFPGRHGEQIAEGHCRGIPDCWHLPRTRSALPGPCERAAAPSPRGKTFQGYGFRDLKAGRRLGTPVKHSQFDPCRTRAALPCSPGMEPREGSLGSFSPCLAACPQAWQGLWLRVLVPSAGSPSSCGGQGLLEPQLSSMGRGRCQPCRMQDIPAAAAPSGTHGQGRSGTRAPKAAAPWIFPPID